MPLAYDKSRYNVKKSSENNNKNNITSPFQQTLTFHIDEWHYIKHSFLENQLLYLKTEVKLVKVRKLIIKWL